MIAETHLGNLKIDSEIAEIIGNCILDKIAKKNRGTPRLLTSYPLVIKH